MQFTATMLERDVPDKIHDVPLPRREQYHPSSPDWRNEVFYFLLPDRFSDGKESTRKLLDRNKLKSVRTANWRWEDWALSGSDRWQGGTIKGITSKLDYLKKLGVSTIWVGPIFKQRVDLNTYHGYGIQDYLDVDPRFGTRQDLVELVDAAHEKGIYIILDIIFNHSGSNWVYPPTVKCKSGICKDVCVCYEADYTTGQHPFGYWRDGGGNFTTQIKSKDDGVWPQELQNVDYYTRAGTANDLGAGDIEDPNAVHKRTDFCDLRDFHLSFSNTLNDLAMCYKYWIALTDCDGFRIDTLKHVSFQEAENFCGSLKEFAANLGKLDFFIVGEVSGGDFAEDRYIDALAQNMNAALDISDMRLTLEGVAKGLVHPLEYFEGFEIGKKSVMGSHRKLGKMHVSILNDHDHAFGENNKVRFSVDAATDHQVVAGVALQLFTLGIPCIYYGTEQALSGPEEAERQWLPDWRTHDRYLREAMFGPEHPLLPGKSGLDHKIDTSLPGFGPCGTAGYHSFDPDHPAYARIAALTAIRRKYPALRIGRQYLRQTSFLGKPFGFYGPGEIIAWSRILTDEEFLCVLNSNGKERRGAEIIVDASLVSPDKKMWIVVNTADLKAATPVAVDVKHKADGTAYIEIQALPPSEIVVLTNYP